MSETLRRVGTLVLAVSCLVVAEAVVAPAAHGYHILHKEDCYYPDPDGGVLAPCMTLPSIPPSPPSTPPLPTLPASCRPDGGFAPATCAQALGAPLPPGTPTLPSVPSVCQPLYQWFDAVRCLYAMTPPVSPLPPLPTIPPVPPVPVPPLPSFDNPDDCKRPIFDPTDPGDIERCAAALVDEIFPGACNSLDKLDCPDQDGDGVHDRYDACPGQYGDRPNGCPDSDGDGIEDRADRCPWQAGPAPSGCPDGDGDTVPDNSDACPYDAGSGANGCPTVVADDPTAEDQPGEGPEDTEGEAPHAAYPAYDDPDHSDEGGEFAVECDSDDPYVEQGDFLAEMNDAGNPALSTAPETPEAALVEFLAMSALARDVPASVFGVAANNGDSAALVGTWNGRRQAVVHAVRDIDGWTVMSWTTCSQFGTP